MTALRKLYHLGERGFWSPSQDIDWALACPLEPPRYYRMAWRRFPPFLDLTGSQQDELCIKQYKWVLDQGVHGELFGMLAANWIAANSECVEERMMACELAWEEARHYEAIEKLASKFGPIGPPHPEIVKAVDFARDNGLLGVYLGLHAGERAGVPSYELLARFGGPLMKAVYGRIGSDEARHIGFGALGIRRHKNSVSTEEGLRLAQQTVDGYAYWAYPSPTWAGYGFDEETVGAFWASSRDTSRLKIAMLKAFQGLGFSVH